MHGYHDKIQELIDLKGFEELSLDEKELVLVHLTEEEYLLRRSIVVSTKGLWTEEAHFLAPDPVIKHNLKQALRARNKNWNISDIFENIFSYKVPVYQAVCGIALLVAGLWWLENELELQVVKQQEIVYQPKIDTVFVKEMVPVVEFKTVEKIVKVYVHEKEPVFPDIISQDNFPANQKENNPGNINIYNYTRQQLDEQQEKSMGATSLPQSELEQFLVVVN